MLLSCSMWTRDRMVVVVVVTTATMGLIPFVFAESPKNAAAAKETARPRALNEEKVKSQLASFRSNRTPNARRVAIVKELSAFGPEVVARVEPAILREIERVGATPVDLPDTSQFDEEISKFRSVLVELRKDPELTKEKITAIGDPALERLKSLYQLRAQRLAPRETAREKVRTELARWEELLELLAMETDDGDAKTPFGLPTAEIRKQLKEVGTKVAFTPDEQWAREVQIHNAEMFRKVEAREAAGMQMMNELRVIVGLNPLKADVQLCSAARGHSADMATENFFAHESPVPNKTTFVDRAKLEGTTASGENIFAGSPSPNAAISGWFHSPGHHKNMLGEHRRQGLGRFNGHWTQMFGH